jgi:hypothetical protein
MFQFARFACPDTRSVAGQGGFAEVTYDQDPSEASAMNAAELEISPR